jgi:hypothetical protein
MSTQILTLQLDGITAADYLAWSRDPEPPLLERGLRIADVEAAPLSNTVTVVLVWDGPAPAPAAAAALAGLPVTSDVRRVLGRTADAPVAVAA